MIFRMDSYVELDGWKLNIRFSSAHMLPEHKKCGRLHGHTYALHAKVYGEKDENGVVIDFSRVKSSLEAIADSLDHRVLIPEKDRAVGIDELEVAMKQNGKRYVFPREDCVLLPMKTITAENLAEYVLGELLKHIDAPKNMTKIEVSVDEGFGQGATVAKMLR